MEAKELQEKEEVRMERRSLFEKRRYQQARLRRIEQKMELVQIVSTNKFFSLRPATKQEKLVSKNTGLKISSDFRSQ